jgi:lipopolysaccharide transport system permease protein
VLSGLVDFALAFVVLVGMILAFGIPLTINIIWLPLFLLLAFITALGVGLWLSALNVEYRDIRYMVPFLLQVWMFISPVVYPSSLLAEPWRTVYGLNPMAGVLDGFRWALLGSGDAPGPMIGVSAVVAVVLLITGTFYFRRMERNFADVV